MRPRTSIRALVIEDVEDDAILLVKALQRAGIDISHRRVETMEQLEAALQDDWDVVYSDYTLPGFNGMDALDVVRRHDSDLPFIFVSGTLGEDRAVAAVKAGANDYVIKGNYARLPVATERVLEEARIRRENRIAQARITQLINVDLLTGLASRSVFLEKLHEALEEARPWHHKVGVITVNIDRFRTINDTLGMNGGDQLIIELGRRLKEAVSTHGLVARLYADQFAIVIPAISEADELESVAGDVLECFETSFPVHRYSRKVTGSAGLAMFPDDGEQLHELLNNVNLAQTLAKQSKGTTRTRYTRAARTKVDTRLQLEAEIEAAIRNEEFILHFQPQIDTTTGHIVGAESLVRWMHPRKGLLQPAAFIAAAEESGLILPLGNLICRIACEQMRAWRHNGLPAMPIAINVSSQQFQEPSFASMLGDLMRMYDINPACIELEITETALMSDPENVFSTLKELRDAGLKIALDDFGTGYSSMSYLDSFPIDVLKIDRSFVGDLPHDSRKVAIVNAILSIAEQLQIKVIAEGVETSEQLEFLRALGCENAQGFRIHRPADAKEVFPALLEGTIKVPRDARH